MKVRTLKCGKDQEIFLWEKRDRMIHLLPGETIPADPEKGYRRISINRKETVSLPVGAEDKDSDGRKRWGGFFLLSCRLISPRRFALSNGQMLLQGQSGTEILKRKLRRMLGVEIRRMMLETGRMERVNSCDSWKTIRTRAEETLLREGWKLTAFLPGTIQSGGTQI